ncbi:MAG: prepilin-type cleavage/methylation domain-containing protein [Gammaproteobacteria bacterium]
MEIQHPRNCHGITMVEFIMSVMLVTLMLTLMVPAALRLIDDAREDNVISQLEEIQERIDDFYKSNSRYPISLVEIYESVPMDPWNNPYQYLSLSDGLQKTRGQARKYKGMKLINSDYDLYSMGPDGKSVPPLTAEASRDDVIRAQNGKFIGNVSDFE